MEITIKIDQSEGCMCLLKHWGLLVNIAPWFIKVETERVGRPEHLVIIGIELYQLQERKVKEAELNCRCNKEK
jgi:hypothetical protein